ncbi:uncharacterized protein LOC141642095 isoform X2 [Silene latifolia]|uniref:uncharacterized protein LOC141642095 isoform X2 n=1 Tax=Silene latifolia TaxID=37657 RepID=UPI003D7772F9
MKTQDHEKRNDGNGGVHVCHKCGWPFPKAHPSSKHRKAHKRVCGTIEGYRLDNGVRDETRLDGDVVEPSSDDDVKSPSEKVAERTISRRASSGVSSKLSGSTISEDDVFTDAGTQISESSVTLRREESTGLIQRYYSMQNGNELDDTWTLDTSSADNLCTPDLLNGDKLQSIDSGEGESKKLEATAGSQEYISSETSKELDVVLERGKEVISSKGELDIITSYSETPEEVAHEVTILKGATDEVKGVSDEVLSSARASVEDNKVKGVSDEVLGSVRPSAEDNKEGFNNVDFSGKTKIGADENIYVAPVTDLLPLQQPDVDINMSRSDLVKDLNNDPSGEDGGISSEEKKPVKLVEKIFPEGVTMDAAHIQETTANKGFSVNADGSDDSENNLAVRNPMFAKPAIEAVPSQDLELNNTSGTTRYGVPDKILASADGMTGHSQGESLHISQCNGEIEGTTENARSEKSKGDNGTDAILISTSKLEVEAAEHSSQSSAVVNHCSNEEVTEKTSCTLEGDTEGDVVTKPHVTIPAVDNIVDLGSQSGSLDGNWGSFSVMSASSDAQPPTADTISSNQPRELVPEEILSTVPKPVVEDEPSQNQIPVKTEVQNEQMECVPEIQTSKEQQHANPALQTGLTPTVSDVANELDKGKKDKEIIEKVSNWDSGKQRTPLKALLGEATAKSRAESPIHDNQIPSPAPEPQTENVIVNADHPEMEAAEEETGKEWNSPARYPVNIKTEKRSKSRTYWAPFLCCSSVNAR